MIYDCTLFLDEFDLLEIRLRELGDVVDRFVVVESNRTFTCNPKPFHFPAQADRFRRWLDRIIYVPVYDLPQSATPFEREEFNRNCIVRGLGTPRPEDIVLVGDVDEIPRASVIANYRPEQGIVGLRQTLSRYYLNCQSEENWIGTKIIPASMFTHPPDFFRWHAEEIGCTFINDAGWHFTSTGGAEAFAYKLASFSHSGKPWHHEEVQAVRDGIAPVKYGLKAVPIDGTFPTWVQANQETVKRWGLLYESAKELVPC